MADETMPLARRTVVLALGIEDFKGGDETAEVRLEIRGILVGVSFGFPDAEFISVDGGGSLFSLEVCVMVPTDGEPAMVGN